jgi:hypothetical protein
VVFPAQQRSGRETEGHGVILACGFYLCLVTAWLWPFQIVWSLSRRFWRRPPWQPRGVEAPPIIRQTPVIPRRCRLSSPTTSVDVDTHYVNKGFHFKPHGLLPGPFFQDGKEVLPSAECLVALSRCGTSEREH